VDTLRGCMISLNGSGHSCDPAIVIVHVRKSWKNPAGFSQKCEKNAGTADMSLKSALHFSVLWLF